MPGYLKYEYIIPQNGLIGWECAVCKISVRGELNESNGMIEPVSGYWNIERQEVYCCAEHSLQREQNLRTGSENNNEAA